LQQQEEEEEEAPSYRLQSLLSPLPEEMRMQAQTTGARSSAARVAPLEYSFLQPQRKMSPD